MFHRILPQQMISENDAYYQRGTLISCELLEKVILFFQRSNYEFITLNQLEKEDKNKVVLTFDDGYEDNYSYVIPLLEKYGINATFYPTLGYCLNQDVAPLDYYYHHVNNHIKDNRKQDWITGSIKKSFISLNHEQQKKFIHKIYKNKNLPSVKDIGLRYMDMEQICSLQEAGHEIGGHSMYHDIYTYISTEKVRQDLTEMMFHFNQYGIHISSFAYTDGQYSNDIIHELLQMNIKKACTIHSLGINPEYPMEIERSFINSTWYENNI